MTKFDEIVIAVEHVDLHTDISFST